METHILHEGPLPGGITPGFEPVFFNLPGFVALRRPEDCVSFYLIDKKRRSAVAGIHFHVSEGCARSPLKAPFGSVEFSTPIHPPALFEFLGWMERSLAKKGVREIFIKNAPRAYSPGNSSLVEPFLINLGYTVSDAEVSAVIPVDDRLFSERIRNSERLRLRQAQNAGFEFRVLPTEKLQYVYSFISRRHQDKGYAVSISGQDLEKACSRYPDRYIFFDLHKNGETVAAAVSIRINRNILSNFMTNHEPVYNHMSPSVLLMNGIYEYCKENEATLLDLGTSALNGQPNFSLLDFKLHIGGEPSAKLSFYKKIA